VRLQAREELRTIKQVHKASRHESRKSIRRLGHELQEEGIELWMTAHHKQFAKSKLTIREKRRLWKWFCQLDLDSSGQISLSELKDQLISTGMKRSSHQVVELMHKLDSDGSGEMGFHEFLRIMRHADDGDDNGGLERLHKLQSDKQVQLETLLGMERRRNLMKAMVENYELRSMERDALLDEEISNIERRSRPEAWKNSIDKRLEGLQQSYVEDQCYIAELANVLRERYGITAMSKLLDLNQALPAIKPAQLTDPAGEDVGSAVCRKVNLHAYKPACPDMHSC
jgi:Ca2+-binding EF-hand superfamily protein